MKPVILSAVPAPGLLQAELEARYTLLPPVENLTAANVPPEAREARVLITLGGLRTDAALIAALPKLGLIACYGTGFDRVDRHAAAARGVKVTNAADANAAAVAEYAMALLLAQSRNLLLADGLMRAGGWTSNRIDRVPLSPGLIGRRLGIYGLGAIGRQIASRAAAFGMEIAYHGRSRQPDAPYAYVDSLHGLAEWAEVLMVSVRAGPATDAAVNAEILAALGPQGVVVNIARGSVIDEPALIAALQSGGIAGAALDVFAVEPGVPEALKSMPNVVLSPHAAALASSAQRAQQLLMLRNIEAFLDGKPLLSEVPAPE